MAEVHTADETGAGDGVSVRRVRALRGPNIYALFPVLKVTLDIGRFVDRPSDTFPGFAERLTAWLPGLQQHGCSVGRPGGFVERLHRGTYLPHIVEHVALELQREMGFRVSFGRVRRAGERSVYDVVVAYEEEEPAREAFETAVRLILAAMEDAPFAVPEALDRLRDLADEHRLGPSTAAIVAAARVRDIPVLRLTPKGSLVQFGYGVHQKRIRASETSLTSAIACDLCQSKPLTNALLRGVGVPVPDGRPVTSADEAWAVARDEIGVERGALVVVKPEAGNQGRGVSVRLSTEHEVRSAYVLAEACRRGDVLVERHVQGYDFRLLVVNGRLVAAARRDPAMVTGDGRHTVAELVREVNRDPRRREGHASSLTRLRLDDASDLVLAQQNLTREAVPGPGQTVRLRSNGNLSTGGTATDVTEEVHPANARLAELAAQVLGMDVAGIDVICEDIAQPLRAQGGAIVEVNAAPGLRMHLSPSYGRPRDVGAPIVDMLYPAGAPARIPIVAVTGTNGKTTTTRLVGHCFEAAHHVVGTTTTEGTYIGGERIVPGDCSGPKSARAVLLHPRVEAAVLETARGGILREGLGFDACDVAVVTNISEDHVGLGGVERLEDLQQVKRVVVQSVHDGGTAVLNADDPLVAEMAGATRARVVYFGVDATSPVIMSHLAAGGACVVVQDGAICLLQGQQRTQVVALDRVPFTAGGRIPFQVQNALAAAAAAWAAGLNPATIAGALTTFRTDAATVPGRFNVLEAGGAEVVFDYAHNPAALEALGQALGALGRRHTILVVGLPGDRRDADLRRAIEATLPYTDEYVLFDQSDRRGRARGEVPRLLQACLPATVPSTCAESQTQGIALGWERLRLGARLVILAYDVDGALRQVQELAAGDDGACITPVDAQLAAPAIA